MGDDYHMQEVNVLLQPPLMDSVEESIELQDDIYVETKEKFFLRLVPINSQISVTGPLQAEVYILNDDCKLHCRHKNAQSYIFPPSEQLCMLASVLLPTAEQKRMVYLKCASPGVVTTRNHLLLCSQRLV